MKIDQITNSKSAHYYYFRSHCTQSFMILIEHLKINKITLPQNKSPILVLILGLYRRTKAFYGFNP